jgi:hypothetical protein
MKKLVAYFRSDKFILVVMMLVFCFAVMPANAADKSEAKKDGKKSITSKPAGEKIKIQLPDGVYLYDAILSRTGSGEVHVGFQKYFVVKNNIIYSSREAMKKFGISKLNKLFIENKKYKILLGGARAGEIDISSIDSEGDCEEGCISYKEELSIKSIKEGPMYGVPSIYLGRLGSAINYIAVPEAYKEKPVKIYKTIPPEEVDKISTLLKAKLFDLVKNRKEITRYQLKYEELNREKLELLDKIINDNEEFYVGIYRYGFKISPNSRPYKVVTLVPAFEIVFTVKNDNVYVITSQYDDKTLFSGNMKILGTLDVDGCGQEELIIEKDFSGEDDILIHLEIYKQNDDGNWTLILKNK